MKTHGQPADCIISSIGFISGSVARLTEQNEINVSSYAFDMPFVTTREAAWYIISVVSVCLSVCQTITFESLDAGSLYLDIRSG